MRSRVWEIPDEDFVVAWQKADSTDTLIESLGLEDVNENRRALTFRASRLRKLGVELKRMRVPSSAIDIASLNAILSRIEKLEAIQVAKPAKSKKSKR